MPDLVRKNAARSQRHFCRTVVGGVGVKIAISDGFFMQRFVDCGAVRLRFTGRQEALRYEKARIIGTRALQANSALRKVSCPASRPENRTRKRKVTYKLRRTSNNTLRCDLLSQNLKLFSQKLTDPVTDFPSNNIFSVHRTGMNATYFD